MIINFVGLFNAPGYIGEISDETHIARELEELGHIVRRIPRDEWREHVIDGKDYPNIPKDLKADINIIAKWHHFYDGSFISSLRAASNEAPVFYWIWDFMYDKGFPDWHIKMAQEADLYLSGEAGIFDEYKKLGIKPYYFQMDVCDGDLARWVEEPKKYDVIFTGSYLEQGHRIEWLKKINEIIPVTIFSWNYEEWKKAGFEAFPAVYGDDYNKLIAQTKIVLGFSVEPNCWGYWSNRVGKVLRAGGLLLQEYAPGMEIQLSGYNADFFNSPQEAINKIKEWLISSSSPYNTDTDRWTSKWKVAELAKLMERYLKSNNGKDWNKLP